jgi:hypothetical protein
VIISFLVVEVGNQNLALSLLFKQFVFGVWMLQTCENQASGLIIVARTLDQ